MNDPIQKPANIIYGVDDIPPLRTTVILGIQHAVLSLIFIVYPLMLVVESGGKPEEAQSVVTMAILAMAIGTFVQCLGTKGIGSGYLAVHITSPIFLPISIHAARMGGLDLVFGMTIIAGIFSMLFSRLLKNFRSLFPAEVCGVAVLMLGISMAKPAVSRFLGLGDGMSVNLHVFAVASLSLGLMLGLSIWTRRRFRLYSVLIGLVAGYTASYATGLMDNISLQDLAAKGLFSMPSFTLPSWKFHWGLLVPFLTTALISSLDTSACIIACQKINQKEWVRPDMANVGRGVLADGIGTTLSGILGTLGTGISSSHIALSSATGATARRIGLVTAILLLLLTFIPLVAILFSRMPTPVIGAVLVYAAAFLITSGMELIVSRMLDTRRIFVVGGSVIIGLAVSDLGPLLETLPPVVSHVIGSPFAAASLSAITLNLFFRIGTNRHAVLHVSPDLKGISGIIELLERKGASWGARRLIVQQAEAAASELLETIIVSKLSDGGIEIQADFDEYNLILTVLYMGRPVILSSPNPTPEELLEDDEALSRLSGAIIRHHADRVICDIDQGKQRIMLHFDH